MTGWFLTYDEETRKKSVVPDEKVLLFKQPNLKDGQKEPDPDAEEIFASYKDIGILGLPVNPVTVFNQSPSYWYWHTANPVVVRNFLEQKHSDFVERFQTTELPPQGLVLFRKGEKIKEKPPQITEPKRFHNEMDLDGLGGYRD